MAKVEVRVKAGQALNQITKGRRVKHPAGTVLTVSEGIYKAFRDKLERTDGQDLHGDAKAKAAAGSNESELQDLGEGAIELAELLEGLAALELKVDAEIAKTWNKAQLAKVRGLVERGGRQPPNFVKDALV